MSNETQRLTLDALSTEQIAPLESLFTPEWPDVWCDLARSFYCSLLSSDVAANEAAALAVEIVHGLVQDLGGLQIYLPNGGRFAAAQRTDRVQLLLKQGRSYKEVATACSVTESWVRKIHRDSRATMLARKR